MLRIALLAAITLALGTGPLAAEELAFKDLRIDHPFARATPPGATVAGAYLKVRNAGKDADRLVRAASPVAGMVEIHEMHMDGSVMRMRAVAGVEIKPGATVTLQPGGYHVMLMNLKAPLAAGQKFPMTLTFERAGSVDVSVAVEAIGASAHKH